jgi:hypothetical protein
MVVIYAPNLGLTNKKHYVHGHDLSNELQSEGDLSSIFYYKSEVGESWSPVDGD